MSYEIHNGECSEVMASMDGDSVDAIVTDAPYAIGLAGSKWDTFGGSNGNQSVSERQAEGRRYASENKGAPRYANSHGRRPTHDEMVAFQESMTPIFTEALRVAKPGAHMLCFGGTRTFHRMACAIEDAGWYVKDAISWNYSQGMPHGQNVERMVAKVDKDRATEWKGWNTQLKPSWESVIVAQKVPDMEAALRHLKEMKECLYRLYARTVESHSTHIPIRYEGETGDSARASAQIQAEDSAARTTQDGRVEDASSQADTSQSALEAVSIALSMTSLWKSTLEEACELTNKYTTEMMTSLITDLRTWSCCLLQTTPDSIIQVATSQSGSNAPVSDVERLFSAVRKRLNAIRILTAPASVMWGDNIRPSWEPIILAVKPMRQTVAANVLEYGTGAMNIDACRVATDDPVQLGRWPANFVHDGSDEVLACFPNAKGQQGDVRDGTVSTKAVCYGDYGPRGEFGKRVESDTSAARFFYCAKASKADRGEFNDHVSVKPTSLMQWLVRLVCRPGGAVLDPFMGSGTTGVACIREGMDFIGIELDPHYCEIAERRMSDAERENAQMELF